MVELLAPAGSMEALKASVAAGCDAVYIGGSMFSARAYADNPDNDNMLEAIKYCHLRGKKLYLTVNTLFKNDELHNRLKEFLTPLYEAGIDGVIVQDIGAMKYISREFPQLPIHVSTQASVTMAEGVNAIRAMCDNITRVVPARELNLNEIKRLKDDSGLEVEVFVHGALCYSYSGMCLLSSFIGGRSGNRGRCAQPCRKKYRGKDGEYNYLLSCKDICGLMHIGELIEAGVDSFKIEGRMKTPQYCAGVVSIYRKYIDIYYMNPDKYADYLIAHKEECMKDIDFLKELYNRGGFNEGYYHTHNGSDMMSFERPNHSGVCVGTVTAVRGREAVITLSEEVNPQDVLEIRSSDGKSLYEYTVRENAHKGDIVSAIVMKGTHADKGMNVYRTKNNAILSALTAAYIDIESKANVSMRFSAHKGQEAELTIFTIIGREEIGCVRKGSIVSAAIKAPTSKDQLKKSLVKTGDSPFVVDSIEFDCDDDIFIPVSELNNLRREAVNELSEGIVDLYKRKMPGEGSLIDEKTGTDESVDELKGEPHISTLVYSDEQFGAVVTSTLVSRIYLSLAGYTKDDYIEKLETKVAMSSLLAKELYIALPYICRAKTYDELKCSKIIETFKDRCGFLVRNKEELYLMHELGAQKYSLDYCMYTMNDVAADVYGEDFTYPLELNSKELSNLCENPGELIVYGYQPAMFSAQCVYKNLNNKCLKAEGIPYSLTYMEDEMNHGFNVMQFCDTCTNIIFNSACLDLREVRTEVESKKITYLRYDFTVENADEIKDILSCVKKDGKNYTYGHFHRGVE